MAFNGHVDSDAEIVLKDEIYNGSTRIRCLSTSSEQSDPSAHSDHSDHSKRSSLDSPEFISPRQWEPPSNLQCTLMLYKNQDESSSSSSPLSLPPAGSQSYSNCRAQTHYSFSDMCRSLQHMRTESNVVPPLGLSSRSSTLNYMRDLDGLKLVHEPQEAYETWCASKQRLRQQQLQRQKELREFEQQRDEARKQAAKLCYEKWLRDKSQLASQQRVDSRLQHASFQAAASSAVAVRHRSSGKPPVRKVEQAEIREVVKSWWLKKQEQQQRERQEQLYHQLKKRREEQRRKQLAEMAWQKWISNVYGKPKPVPMNQGMDSLRGTVSQIYLNPLPWQPLKKTKGDR